MYGRDDGAVGVPWIWRDLLARPPQREHQRVTPAFSRELPDLMKAIGVTASVAHLRFGDDWTLSAELLDAGPMWEDRAAERRDIVHETGRVRIYLTQMQASDDQRRAVERAARREYQVLQGITHRGIAQAVQIRDHHGSPAILFHHDPADLRLDSYLAVHGERLTREVRLDLVRHLAEAVRYAHSRSLYHRALAARSVYVSAGKDGADPARYRLAGRRARLRADVARPGLTSSAPTTSVTPRTSTSRRSSARPTPTRSTWTSSGSEGSRTSSSPAGHRPRAAAH